jgi:hypothetical protein
MTGLDLQGLKNESLRLNKEPGGGNDFLENFVKFPEQGGVVLVRLLGPAMPGMFNRKSSPFFQATRIHRVNGKSLHCLKSLEGDKWEGECPICRYYNWLWKESESKDPTEAARLQAAARAIKPIERYYYNVIVRKEVDEKTGEVRENVGPKILSVGKTLHKRIIAAIVGDENMQEPALGDVTDFKTGRDFKIIKTIRPSGKESYPNYDSSKFMDPSAVDPDQGKLWMENVHDLPALRHTLEADEARIELKKHLGIIPSEEGSGGFDPSEYQVPTSGVTVQQELAPEVSNAAVEAVTAAGGEGLDDDDFINKLREIG